MHAVLETIASHELFWFGRKRCNATSAQLERTKRCTERSCTSQRTSGPDYGAGTRELSRDPLGGCRSCPRKAPAPSKRSRHRILRARRRTRAPSQWTCWVDLCQLSRDRLGRSFAAAKKRDSRESSSLSDRDPYLCLAGCEDP